MLIIALVLAVVSLAALVTAVVTSNELIAWACIGFSSLGVLLLVIDAIRDRNRRAAAPALGEAADRTEVIPAVEDEADWDEEAAPDDEADWDEEAAPDDEADWGEGADGDLTVEETIEDHPDELVYDDPDHDIPSDDESAYPVAAEEAAMHVVSAEDIAAQEYSDAEMESAVETYIESDPSGSYAVIDADEQSYTVYDTSTVSYADNSADDSAIVIHLDETDDSPEADDRPEERDRDR